NGNATSGTRVSQYVRVTDNFTTEEMRPAPDGKNVPMALIIDNGYRGSHTLEDFLRLFVAPSVDTLKLPFLLLLLTGTLGYLAVPVIDRVASPAERPHQASRRFATWLLIALPVIMFGLVYGVGNILPPTDTRLWGGLLLTLLLTVVSIIA